MYGPKEINETFLKGITLNLPSVVLVHICSSSERPPGKVTNLEIFNVTKNEVLLIWKDSHVKTKQVTFSFFLSLSQSEMLKKRKKKKIEMGLNLFWSV